MLPLIPRRQFCLASLALLVCGRRSAGAAGPPAGPASRPAVSPLKNAAIRGHAETLLGRAVRSTFGWGWADAESGVDLVHGRVPKGTPHLVEAVPTARIGILLDLAGQLVQEKSYRDAAIEAGRGVAALQTRAGQVRRQGVMGVLTAGRDDAADVPERAPTHAAVALLLHLIDGQNPPDARLKATAQRAAHWLAGQQNHIGGWASLFPADAAPGRGTKLLRLDTTDLRNTLLTILLGAEVLGDQQLQGSFDHGVDHLLSIRLLAGRPVARTLWGPAYTLDGGANAHADGLPGVPDLLATRHALEAILTGYLLTLNDKQGAALREARGTIANLERTRDGEWYRRYDGSLKPLVNPAATQPASLFAAPAAAASAKIEPQRTAELLKRLDRAQQLAGKLLREEIETAQPLHRRLVLLLAGLAEDALLVDPDPEKASRSPELAGTGGLSETIDALWYEIQTVR